LTEKPKRRGPPKGSLNALKNGSRLSLKRLTVGELPVKLIAVRREGRKYRRDLEAAVLAAKGEITITDCHLIDTASAATIAAGISRWLLRHRLGEMSVADIRGCTADIVRAKERRDAAVQALELDVEPEPLSLSEYVVKNGRTIPAEDSEDAK
jgi:hypothetical protein